MIPVLQAPLPGGPELVILLLVFLLFLGVLAAPVAVLVLAYLWWSGDDEAEIAELRARVARLEDELAGERGDPNAAADDTRDH